MGEDNVSWPPIKNGTKIITIKANAKIDDWTEEASFSRQWEAKGTVIMHHDSHGLCYEVQHEDGTVGYYDPSEFEVMRE